MKWYEIEGEGERTNDVFGGGVDDASWLLKDGSFPLFFYE